MTTTKAVIFLFVALALVVAAPRLEAQGQNVMLVESATASPAAAASVLILLTQEQETDAYQIALTYDSTRLTFEAVTTAGLDVETLIFPNVIEFEAIVEDPDVAPGLGWAGYAAILDLEAPFDNQTIPPGDQQSIAEFHFTTHDAVPGDCAAIELVNGLGTPPLDNFIVVGGFTVLVDLVDGEICFVDPQFLRGDADASGAVSGLVDGLFILNYQFIPGAPEPPCFDAADVDDSGSVTGIVDGLYLLNYFFIPGSPSPPDPGAMVCGTDPTSDALGCAVSACP